MLCFFTGMVGDWPCEELGDFCPSNNPGKVKEAPICSNEKRMSFASI